MVPCTYLVSWYSVVVGTGVVGVVTVVGRLAACTVESVVLVAVWSALLAAHIKTDSIVKTCHVYKLNNNYDNTFHVAC